MFMKKSTKILIIIAVVLAFVLLAYSLSVWARVQYGLNQVCMVVQSERSWAREGTDYKVEYLFNRHSSESTEDGRSYDAEYHYRATIYINDIEVKYYRVLWIGNGKETRVEELGANDG